MKASGHGKGHRTSTVPPIINVLRWLRKALLAPDSPVWTLAATVSNNSLRGVIHRAGPIGVVFGMEEALDVLVFSQAEVHTAREAAPTESFEWI
jgi:hypothetical protein